MIKRYLGSADMLNLIKAWKHFWTYYCILTNIFGKVLILCIHLDFLLPLRCKCVN